ncbi:hypothetical protein [Candidatus Hakubella thermalkaliphila]|uniref:Uncharacterized protein n=1 Tax=Candidatus Hakubella thermalkaliphila TaxID=2754717 RepID=A0A6V8Q7P7_9ACTN|nr:hypothetical protein [Candidatus Hakubella thermalkaliphila]GFP40769.1 hypothetical protein HKBW3S47_02466 [Candidatus Hakubella thermalkaliphila]
MYIKEIQNPIKNDDLSLKDLLPDLVSGRNNIPCTLFLNLSHHCQVDSRFIGQHLDEAGIKVDVCAFGCFPKTNDTPTAPNLPVKTLLDMVEMVYGDSISCTLLWKLAFRYKGNLFKAVKQFNLRGIKITGCRLGFF